MNTLVNLNNKNTDKNTIHSYLPLYDTILEPIKDTATNILEVGVLTGGSIQLWHDYFTNATIYGCDLCSALYINPLLLNNNRVILNLNETAYTYDYIKKKFIDKNITFDFILDDGPHTLESQIDFIKLYSLLLKDTGILIIEDVQDIKWLDTLKNITPNNLKQYIKTYDLRKNKNRGDDIVFTINKNIR